MLLEQCHDLPDEHFLSVAPSGGRLALLYNAA